MSERVKYFGPGREPAVLIRDAAEFSKPAVFYYSPCSTCGADHRFMPVATVHRCPVFGHPVFEMLPATSCKPPQYRGAYMCACAVIDDRVYRVIDLPGSKATRERKRELVDG